MGAQDGNLLLSEYPGYVQNGAGIERRQLGHLNGVETALDRLVTQRVQCPRLDKGAKNRPEPGAIQSSEMLQNLLFRPADEIAGSQVHDGDRLRHAPASRHHP